MFIYGYKAEHAIGREKVEIKVNLAVSDCFTVFTPPPQPFLPHAATGGQVSGWWQFSPWLPVAWDLFDYASLGSLMHLFLKVCDKIFFDLVVMKWWALSPLREKGLGLVPEWVRGLSGWSLHAFLAHQAEWSLWSVTVVNAGHVIDWLATSPGQGVPRPRPVCLWLQHHRTQSMCLAMCNTH